MFHISAVLNEDSSGESRLKKYNSVVSWNAYRSQSVRPAKRRKIAAPRCGTCQTALSRPFACLSCSYTGCWKDGHVQQHLRTSGHGFCVDAKSGYVFCAKCDDFIYDAKLDEIQLAASVAAEEKLTRFQVSRKPRERYVSWTPNQKEAGALEGATAIPCQGRRGLLNLGQTCFLNAVLQCLVHNPLLRNYFLSDKHNCKTCKVENCTSCEMDKLFTEVYSDDTIPFGPITFLATTWKASSELAGYAQQDAHEFFITALNQIHLTSRGFTNVSCNCIIHSTFGGKLQSDVKCDRCGNVTSKVDDILDVSLELRSRPGEAVGEGNTLAGCLRKYTQPEKQEYRCDKCGKASHEATKRLSIRKLPPVLSFQFKRFEHKTNDKSSARKIDATIRFPASLNMAPYTTLVVQGQSPSYQGPEAMYEYDLFAVICHEGQINNGHYTNFARFEDEWYRFDDDKVTHSTLTTALTSPAYMCFYVKRHLDYKPYMTPSYVLAQQNEAAKEAARAERERVEREREGREAGVGGGAGSGGEREREKEREKERERERERADRERERERERERARIEAARVKTLEDDLLDLV